MLPSKMVTLCWAVLLSACLLLGWAFWSLLWPFDPLTVEPGSWTVVNADKTVRRGETLVVRVKYCKNADLTAQMVSSIEQGPSLWLLAPQQPALTFGCHDHNIGIAVIPTALPTISTNSEGHGKAVLRVRLNYQINPLRMVTYSFVTEQFTITQ